MSNLELNEDQEFFIGGQRYVIKNGAPVQEAKRGLLGGELVRFNQLEDGDIFYIKCTRSNWGLAKTLTDDHCVLGFNVLGDLPVEINVPQPQAKGRVMAASEAADLPDIVGKKINCNGRVGYVASRFPDEIEPIRVNLDDLSILFVNKDSKIEVLD